MENNKTWQDVLGAEKQKPYFQQVLAFVREEQLKGKHIYPASADIFNAFKYTSFANLKVVILGQDPYHGAGQAHGLCFSVQAGVVPPPSLKNIFKELHSDLGLPIATHGNLEKWAKQGVLLLNTVLTVEAGQPQSHANRGWETFTDHVISTINAEKEGVIFLLWGAPAQRKTSMITPQKQHILATTHPSPLSAHRGFMGCKHFSKTNALLQKMGKEEINWSI